VLCSVSPFSTLISTLTCAFFDFLLCLGRGLGEESELTVDVEELEDEEDEDDVSLDDDEEELYDRRRFFFFDFE
jgi:hypothetical protein